MARCSPRLNPKAGCVQNKPPRFAARSLAPACSGKSKTWGFSERHIQFTNWSFAHISRIAYVPGPHPGNDPRWSAPPAKKSCSRSFWGVGWGAEQPKRRHAEPPGHLPGVSKMDPPEGKDAKKRRLEWIKRAFLLTPGHLSSAYFCVELSSTLQK